MGCDMYVIQEIKIDDKWMFYGLRHPDRDYTLFGKFFGVRGDSHLAEAGFGHRGLPYGCFSNTALGEELSKLAILLDTPLENTLTELSQRILVLLDEINQAAITNRQLARYDE